MAFLGVDRAVESSGDSRDRWVGATIWLTGLPAAGKTTLACSVIDQLEQDRFVTYHLDGDELRRGLTSDLGFDAASRRENIRRAGHVARMLGETGVIVVASLISPYEADRAMVREIHDQAGLAFFEVFVDTPLAECERRDPRGLYARARRQELQGLTGVDDPYEPPQTPEVVVHPGPQSVPESANAVVNTLYARDLRLARKRA